MLVSDNYVYLHVCMPIVHWISFNWTPVNQTYRLLLPCPQVVTRK